MKLESRIYVCDRYTVCILSLNFHPKLLGLEGVNDIEKYIIIILGMLSIL